MLGFGSEAFGMCTECLEAARSQYDLIEGYLYINTFHIQEIMTGSDPTFLLLLLFLVRNFSSTFESGIQFNIFFFHLWLSGLFSDIKANK